ncbi:MULTISPECIES: sulfite exporter TauE/SafE family protein [Streptomyces]|uniref:Probable membrane transporter protein n=1 Tax=Streptomyces olivaceiscleroticus TaxID=68245 RepID=A0ABN1BJI2_9ACTN|nr:sulfite exporter TauE/SafE family protein [Streptomyces niger]
MWSSLLFAAVVVCAAYTVRGLTGFGSGPIMAPLLALVMDLKTVIAVSVFLQFAVGGYMAFRTRRSVDRSVVARAALPGIVGAVAGAWLLSYLPVRALLFLVGFGTLWYAVRMLRGQKARTTEPSAAAALGAGGLSGLLEGMFGAGGPPFVVFLNRNQPDKSLLRGTVLGYFILIDGFLTLCYFALPTLVSSAPVLDRAGMMTALLMLAPAAAGAWIGDVLHHRASPAAFRTGVSATLVLSGVAVLLKAV